jgi:hypothetical protein
MEQLTPRTMAATPWLLLLCLAAGGVLQARVQPDSKGIVHACLKVIVMLPQMIIKQNMHDSYTLHNIAVSPGHL